MMNCRTKTSYATALLLAITTLSGCGSQSAARHNSSSNAASHSSAISSHSSANNNASSQSETIDEYEYLSAGKATYVASDGIYGSDAYSHALPEIRNDISQEAIFKQGDHTFRNQRKNTGPLINDTSCQGCHIADGRGSLPSDNSVVSRNLLFKFSLGQNDSGQDIPEPTYGFQLQTLGINNNGEFVAAGTANEPHTGEAFVSIDFELIDAQYPDGETYQLRNPVYTFSHFNFGALDPQTLTSPRLAPPMFGMGLLESINESDIIGQQDIDDIDNDGISGKAKWVHDSTQDTLTLGRFGWKASAGSVLQQSAGAFANDMGVTSRFNLEEPCSPIQITCLDAANRETKKATEYDINDVLLASVEFYGRTLAVPARRGYNPQNQLWDGAISQGQALFLEADCAKCHTPKYFTGTARESVMGTLKNLIQLQKTDQPISALSQQAIYPYTDLLLHDMGGQCDALSYESLHNETPCEVSNEQCHWVQRCEGLADGRPDGAANGREWRTTALWGIGLTQVVNPSATFLHDGRARTIEEAILWHGGEAQNSLNAFQSYSKKERMAVLEFLHSL